MTDPNRPGERHGTPARGGHPWPGAHAPSAEDPVTTRRPRHPGFANYPYPEHTGPDTPAGHPVHHRSVDPQPGTRSAHSSRQLPPLSGSGTGHGTSAHPSDVADGSRRPPRMPRKITVTRVAAMRSRELTRQGIATFHRAATADGAGKSGLTALIYAYMANFACDAALAVALANTLFFSAATGESKSKVALYLLITLAPFAVIAPLIGPALDRLQRGRRLALAASFVVRIGLAVALALNFDSWVLYPAALGMLVMSKSFGVLKSAMTPRVLPPEMDLVRVNSRLQIFGLLGGTTVAGAVAGAIALLTGSAGALWFTALLAAGGAYLSMRIPSWVEVTEGEVPATLSYHGNQTVTGQEDLAHRPKSATSGKLRQPLGRTIIISLWGTATIKMLIGFLFLYVPFVAKAHTDKEGLVQLAMAGAIGAAAGIGNIAGNALGARLKLGRPGLVVLRCTIAATAVAALAAGTHTMITVAVAALIANIASALAKVSLDASIQNDLPDESRASAFGRSETVLQLSWVLGGALGVLLPTEYWIGFTVISVLLTIGLVQTILSYRGYSVLPGLGSSHRPRQAAPEGNTAAGASAGNVR